MATDLLRSVEATAETMGVARPLCLGGGEMTATKLAQRRAASVQLIQLRLSTIEIRGVRTVTLLHGTMTDAAKSIPFWNHGLEHQYHG